MPSENKPTSAKVTRSSASIDWTTFGFQVFGLNGNTNPTFSFDGPSQSTNVYTNSTSDYAQDWSSPLSATEGVAFASASADALVAQRAQAFLPKQGTMAPWRLYQNYVKDQLMLRYARVDDPALEFRSAPCFDVP